MAGCLPEAIRFRRAIARVREEQAQVLQHLLAANADTAFGLRHRFAAIRSPREYQEHVPTMTYDAYRPWIDRVAAGAPRVLTGESVRRFVPTSGSAGAAKLALYTASLQREFQRGIRPWIADLFQHHPELMAGPAYWSITPALAPGRRTRGDIPIGFDDDSSYVGGWQQRFVQAVMVTPATRGREPDLEAWRYETVLALVRSANLRIISVWNPTFLSLLIERLPGWGDALERDLRPDTRRAAALRAALRAGTPAEAHAILWPRLGMISCWTDGNARAPAAHLARLFPHARIQGKGLIATEGFVSFPLIGHEGAALAVRSHFLEFAPVDAPDRPLLAHELHRGQRYSVILSTGGGLYRYRLDDVVEVVGHCRQCPLVRFVGRAGLVSDWYGEKLSDAHVAGVLGDTFEALGISPAFAMLACDNTLASPAYVLYVETAAGDEVLRRAAARVDAALRRGFHYDYARRLGQLGPVQAFRAEGASHTYMRTRVQAGQREGDVKPTAIDRRDGWSQALRGHFVPAAAGGVAERAARR